MLSAHPWRGCRERAASRRLHAGCHCRPIFHFLISSGPAQRCKAGGHYIPNAQSIRRRSGVKGHLFFLSLAQSSAWICQRALQRPHPATHHHAKLRPGRTFRLRALHRSIRRRRTVCACSLCLIDRDTRFVVAIGTQRVIVDCTKLEPPGREEKR